MRIGIVCPYSFDVPGGVQFHVRDLAEHLIGQGHHVSVLAPADHDTALPGYLESVGRTVPVRYNGSVARLSFGPVTAARVGRWVDRGEFDVVHLHEPVTPSISLLALWAAEGPIVATFHTSNIRSRAMQAAYPLLRPSLEKIAGRIAVSEDARRTVTTHVGGDAVVIPNGVNVDRFATAVPRPQWQGAEGAPTLAFLGRIDEPRKGLQVLAAAMPGVLAAYPGARLLVVGPGDAEAARARMAPDVLAATEFLGAVSDADKASLLASVDLYVAPHTGGESFGIVLVEAMSAGAPVVASDLPAFLRVLDGGRAGATFRSEDTTALTHEVVRLVGDPAARAALAEEGRRRARQFDWSVVAEEVMAVYETVTHGAGGVRADTSGDTRWTRMLRGLSRPSDD
ncbi:glycosyltransferase family 4 protein [Phycicoccus sp. SLBN-51]|jgi:phosphatidylinositol alpha-mannosyltransferase|uniref:glycosyltransferase family 4 protein n=1 Tax=Phycicoccus sp. SLBN-51 TaxID=2768447 RepID=UPI001153843C|nr:glycosyltransferase family 4 protein [Phycicoccus sp. SLBN-51]TQJ50742.1 phosphatidylinositol alpha-mannosyltransferase [Phycicoccus sp. SLBN-51]